MATTGPLDSIYSKIQSYLGEFFMSRQQLIDAGNKIEQALSTARSMGTAQIGAKTFSVIELEQLSARNAQLLEENADLQIRVKEFQDAYDNIASGAETVMDAIVPEEETWYDTPASWMGGAGLGLFPGVVVPAAYLVGVGMVLSGAVYLFLSHLRSHLSNVAGDAGSNLIIYGGITLLAVWYAKKQRWI